MASDDKLSLLTLKSQLEKFYPKHDFTWKESQAGFTALCPMHEDKHRSLSIFMSNTGKPMYKCFSCGGIIPNFRGTSEPSFTISDLASVETNNLLDVKYAEALIYIKDRVLQRDNENVVKIEEIEYTRNESVEGFIKSMPTIKAVSPALAEYFITKFPDHKNIKKIKTLKNYIGWIAFFYNDIRGNITQIKLRQPYTKKIFTIALQDTGKPSAFMMPMYNKKQDRHIVYVVEGEFDCIIPSVLITLKNSNNHFVCAGTVSKLIEVSNYLNKLGYITIISPDNDVPGKEIETIDNLKQIHNNIGFAHYGDFKDFGDLFTNHTAELAADILNSIKIVRKETLIHGIEKLLSDSDKEYLNSLKSDIADIYAEKKGIRLQDNGLIVSIISAEKLLTMGHEQKFNLFFPSNEISIIAGQGGVGKTYSAIKLGLEYVNHTPNKKCLLWFTEDSQPEITKRTHYLIKKYGIKNFKNLSFLLEPGLPLVFKNFSSYQMSEEFDKFKSIIDAYDLIFLDPFISFSPVSENENIPHAMLFQNIRRAISHTDKSIVFLHHTSKIKITSLAEPDGEYISSDEAYDRQEKVRGASAIVNGARLVCYTETHPFNKQQRITSIIKSNIGEYGRIILRIDLPEYQSVKTALSDESKGKEKEREKDMWDRKDIDD